MAPSQPPPPHLVISVLLEGPVSGKQKEYLECIFFFFCFITLKPRVAWYTKSMRLKYELASGQLRISMK